MFRASFAGRALAVFLVCCAPFAPAKAVVVLGYDVSELVPTLLPTVVSINFWHMVPAVDDNGNPLPDGSQVRKAGVGSGYIVDADGLILTNRHVVDGAHDLTVTLSDGTRMPAGLAYPSSKAALNMITAMYARELRDTPIKVNAANPGYTKTDLNRNSGFRSVTEGAEATVYLATLPADGPSGILWGHLWSADGPADAYGRLPW